MVDRDLPPSRERQHLLDGELELHSPEELLHFADRMLKSGDLNLMRAAVMESMTALESFVQKTVFGVLKGTMEPLLVRWLEDKTKMDFESRLGVLTPVALGKPIDKSGELWRRYVDAKRIRNQVSHSGRRIALESAREVYQTAYDWLAYLGSAIEVDLALLRFKNRVESGKVSIVDGVSAEGAIVSFFSSKKAASVIVQPTISSRTLSQDTYRPDVLLKYGSHVVVIETVFLPRGEIEVMRLIEGAITQIERYLTASEASRGAITIFAEQYLPHPWGNLRKLSDGQITTIGIQVPSENFRARS